MKRAKADVISHIEKSNDKELKEQGEIIARDIDTIIASFHGNAPIKRFSSKDVSLIPSLQSYNDELDTLDSQPSWLNGPCMVIH